MIYVCEHCGFLFRRSGVAEQCPDCGKQCIREANDVERKEYEEREKNKF